MNTPIDTLVFSLDASRLMLMRFAQDLKPAEYLHRVVPKSNCAAWTIGHLVIAERRFGQRVGAEQPALPEGFDKRFARDEAAPMAADFGDVSILLPLFNAHRDATIAAVRALPPARLTEPLQQPSPMFKTLGESIAFASLHVVSHTGQLIMIRRSLGRPIIV